jgi:hypothetical protein
MYSYASHISSIWVRTKSHLGGATGSHVTGSDVSHVTGSDVSHMTRSDPVRKYVLRICNRKLRNIALVGPFDRK